MDTMLTNEYVEIRNGAYYVAASRIGLDVVVYDFRRRRTANAIFDAYPSIGCLAKVYGAISLEEQDRRFEEIKARYSLTPEMTESFERGRRELPARHF